jgi:hypothetical protein
MNISSQLQAPAALPSKKEPRYPLVRRLGGPQSRSGRGDEEENLKKGIKLLGNQRNKVRLLTDLTTTFQLHELGASNCMGR